jgi:RNA 2',3'-cyclic 3'-phosphodiesterase
LLFMARPEAVVLSSMKAAMADAGLCAQLGAKMFVPANWHQSLSDRHHGDPVRRACLLRAGARVRVPAFDLVVNRVCSQGSHPNPIHWSFRARGTKPGGLTALTDSLRAGIETEGLGCEGGHTAHLTISYGAPVRLASPLAIAPIVWTIDAFELVESRDGPYRYETVERWPLLPPADPDAGQLELFQAPRV